MSSSLSSFTIAQIVGKRHATVVHDIEHMLASSDATHLKDITCVPQTQVVDSGKVYFRYILNRAACENLCETYPVSTKFSILRSFVGSTSESEVEQLYALRFPNSTTHIGKAHVALDHIDLARKICPNLSSWVICRNPQISFDDLLAFCNKVGKKAAFPNCFFGVPFYRLLRLLKATKTTSSTRCIGKF